MINEDHIDSIDEIDLLNSIERRLHKNRNTLLSEAFANRLLNIYTRYANGFYDQADPWADLRKDDESDSYRRLMYSYGVGFERIGE